ncbi:MAG: hypothetical protein IPP51_07435 [Bacteroidetes bacterium]|nr:hypothetical protein [Bacteroidota bacterium]
MKSKLNPGLSLPLLIGKVGKTQNMDNRWLLGFGFHFIDYTSTDPIFKGFFDTKDYNSVPAFAKFNVSRSLNKSFALDLSYSMTSVSKRKLQISDSKFFGDVDLSLKYMFANGYILKENACIDPYLLAGPGMSWYGKESSFAFNVGLGSNFWLSPNVGVFAQTVLNKSSKEIVGDYFQHSVGLVIPLWKRFR